MPVTRAAAKATGIEHEVEQIKDQAFETYKPRDRKRKEQKKPPRKQNGSPNRPLKRPARRQKGRKKEPAGGLKGKGRSREPRVDGNEGPSSATGVVSQPQAQFEVVLEERDSFPESSATGQLLQFPASEAQDFSDQNTQSQVRKSPEDRESNSDSRASQDAPTEPGSRISTGVVEDAQFQSEEMVNVRNPNQISTAAAPNLPGSQLRDSSDQRGRSDPDTTHTQQTGDQKLPPLHEDLRFSLRNIRACTAKRRLLQEKLEKIESKRRDKRYFLYEIMSCRNPQEEHFGRLLEAFVPQNDHERGLVQRHTLRVEQAEHIRMLIQDAESSMSVSMRTVAKFMFRLYGDEIPSKDLLMSKIKPDEEWDYSSGDDDADRIALRKEHERFKQRNQSTHQDLEQQAEPAAESRQESQVDPEAQAQQRRELAKRQRRDARRALGREILKFNKYWSIQKFKDQPGRTAVERGRASFLIGQQQTQDLKGAEDAYSAAAAEARMLDCTEPSFDDPRSMTISQGTFSQEGDDIEMADDRPVGDNPGLDKWFDGQPQSAEVPELSVFEPETDLGRMSLSASPEFDSPDVGIEVILPEGLLGSHGLRDGMGISDRAAVRTTRRIREWNDLRSRLWVHMLDNWEEAAKNEHNEPILRPAVPTKPDPLGFDRDVENSGVSEVSAADEIS